MAWIARYFSLCYRNNRMIGLCSYEKHAGTFCGQVLKDTIVSNPRLHMSTLTLKHKKKWSCLKYILPSIEMKKTPMCTVPNQPHIPVMAEEVIEYLEPKGKQVFLDLTFGAGGHSKQLLERSPEVRLICLDRDPTAYTYAKQLQEQYPGRVLPLLGRFSNLPSLLHKLKIERNSIDGILMDLGVSSMQFDNPKRGFMLSKDGPLDMRMDGSRDPEQLSASEILMHINEDHLYKVLKYYGEEKNARALARAVIESRYLFKKLKTTQELASFVASLSGDIHKQDKLQRRAHPATKTFQAIRILVNNELNELDYALRLAHYYLRKMGIIVTISFHSLEDTIVKRHFTGANVDKSPTSIGSGVNRHRSSLSTYSAQEMQDVMSRPWIPLSKHVILPSEEEIQRNPRSRSAKLRVAAKA